MHTKKHVLLICCLLCLVLLAACGDKAPDPSAGQDTTILVDIPRGVYAEEIAGRGSLYVIDGANGATAFQIVWSGSAFSYGRWDMTGVCNAEKNAFEYNDCVYIETEYTSAEQSTDWDHSLKGLTVHCMGDGEKVNTCWYDAGDLHFSISYHIGKDGQGLTLDQINSIVNCIQ